MTFLPDPGPTREQALELIATVAVRMNGRLLERNEELEAELARVREVIFSGRARKKRK